MPDSVLWGPVIHHFDALSYVLDKQITGVMADTFTSPWGSLPDGASVNALLTLDDDVRAVYSATYESTGHEFFERGQEYYERLVGERATLHMLHRWLVLCEHGKRPRVIRRGSRPVTEESRLLTQLQRALIEGEEPDSSGRRNLGTVAAMEACVRSASERRWVNPQELLAGQRA
jgi:predicted dehydrogenase